MPWYKTEHILPPIGKVITTFDGKKKKIKKYSIEEIYDGKGGTNKDIPKYWSYSPHLQPPADNSENN